MKRRTKIIATLGPSSDSEGKIKKLIKAGMDIARLNFSHGTHEEHSRRIKIIRKLSDQLKKPITILQDIQGPKLRVGNLPETGITLIKGQRVILCPVHDSNYQIQHSHKITHIPLEVPNLAENISVGNHIFLSDGYFELEVTDASEDFIAAEVVLGGILKSHKGINLPGVTLNIPSFTKKDETDLKFGLEQGVDVIALSFIKSAREIENVRQIINNLAPEQTSIPIIAKLERPEAIDKLNEIIDVSDGVMIARGDLAVETSPSFVPIIQKKIIGVANKRTKYVITATQMLDSMINYPRPTRAEASDVANAILDGTDAVMLSGETAVGNYPIESVTMMNTIVREAEINYPEWGQRNIHPEEPTNDDALSITRAARELAYDRNVVCIAVFTVSGRTAMLMSKSKPIVPIMAFTPEITTYQRLGMYWGVTPFQVPYSSSVESMVSQVDKIMIANDLLQKGEQYVLISGLPVGAMLPPNMNLLHTIGSPI